MTKKEYAKTVRNQRLLVFGGAIVIPSVMHAISSSLFSYKLNPLEFIGMYIISLATAWHLNVYAVSDLSGFYDDED